MTEVYALRCLEARSPQVRCPQVWLLLEALREHVLLPCRLASGGCQQRIVTKDGVPWLCDRGALIPCLCLHTPSLCLSSNKGTRHWTWARYSTLRSTGAGRTSWSRSYIDPLVKGALPVLGGMGTLISEDRGKPGEFERTGCATLPHLLLLAHIPFCPTTFSHNFPLIIKASIKYPSVTVSLGLHFLVKNCCVL